MKSKTQTAKKTAAMEAYDERRQTAIQMTQNILKNLQQPAPEDVNWGHVGNLATLLEALENAERWSK